MKDSLPAWQEMIDLVSEMDIMKMIATASRGCSVPNVINLLGVCTQVCSMTYLSIY